MSYGLLLSDCICKAMVFFSVLSVQARITDRLTPGLARNLEEKLPGHKQVLFSWANCSDSQLRVFIMSVNALLAVLLWFRSLRPIGLYMSFGLCFVGLYSDLQLKESAIPHTVLFVLVTSALWFGE
jgi:hypothetical protein